MFMPVLWIGLMMVGYPFFLVHVHAGTTSTAQDHRKSVRKRHPLCGGPNIALLSSWMASTIMVHWAALASGPNSKFMREVL
ncbi:hypothetical protein H4582DRAFT_1952813 [Lactarius indigo]|nr:hypothetical protein H4582DRAFT_1952813 [Lactarius indigo]